MPHDDEQHYDLHAEKEPLFRCRSFLLFVLISRHIDGIWLCNNQLKDLHAEKEPLTLFALSFI